MTQHQNLGASGYAAAAGLLLPAGALFALWGFYGPAPAPPQPPAALPALPPPAPVSPAERVAEARAAGGAPGRARLEAARAVLGPPAPEGAAAPGPQPLYLHWCKPAYHSDGRPDPPARIQLVRITLGERISAPPGQQTRALEGVVRRRGARLHAELRAPFGPSTGVFEGEVKLEKPFEPNGYGFSGAICPTFFVLSTSPRCDHILKNRDKADRELK
jgi:hypothetical protein